MFGNLYQGAVVRSSQMLIEFTVVTRLERVSLEVTKPEN